MVKTCFALVTLPLVVFGTVAPQLPQSVTADTEVSTNLTLGVGPHVGNFNLRLEFAGTPSNNVEIVLGRDADGDGELSFDESGMRMGWDCGRHFIECVSTGERFEELSVGTNDLGRILDWQCQIKRRRIKVLEIANEAGSAFVSVVTNPPAWFYDANWNLMRLTARGAGVRTEQLVYEVAHNGHLLILR